MAVGTVFAAAVGTVFAAAVGTVFAAAVGTVFAVAVGTVFAAAVGTVLVTVVGTVLVTVIGIALAAMVDIAVAAVGGTAFDWAAGTATMTLRVDTARIARHPRSWARAEPKASHRNVRVASTSSVGPLRPLFLRPSCPSCPSCCPPPSLSSSSTLSMQTVQGPCVVTGRPQGMSMTSTPPMSLLEMVVAPCGPTWMVKGVSHCIWRTMPGVSTAKQVPVETSSQCAYVRPCLAVLKRPVSASTVKYAPAHVRNVYGFPPLSGSVSSS